MGGRLPLLLVVLEMIGDVFAVQQPATLGFLNEPVVDRPLAGSYMHNGAGGLVVEEFPENLVALDHLEDTSIGTFCGGEGADNLGFHGKPFCVWVIFNVHYSTL